MQIKLVNVHVNSAQMLCATLTDGSVAVTCEGIAYLDFADYDSMCATYEEWRELATANEDGYTVVAA